MNWAGLQTVLAAQVTTIAGCPTYWRDVTAQWEAWPRVFLSVVSTRKLGQDETRIRHVEADGTLLPRVYGGRVLTVQIQVESRDQNLAASAAAIGEQVRTRLGRPGVLAALRAVDIGISTTTDVRVINRIDDKARVVSYAVFEAVLLTHVSDEEDDSADLGYIETAEIVQTIDPVQNAEVKTYLVGPQEEEEEDVGYSARGVYAPTVTASVGVVIDPVGDLAFQAGFFTRIGNGPGAQPGDIITLSMWLGAENDTAAPATVALSATLPTGSSYSGPGAVGMSTSLDGAGDDPWDGVPWDLVAVVDDGTPQLIARFDLAAGASSVRLVQVSFPSSI